MRTVSKGLLLLGAVLLFGGPVYADEFVRVNTSALSVREGPGTSQRILGYAKDGQTLRVLERSGSWVHVKDGVRGGWVHGDYVTLIQPEIHHITSRSGLKVRSGPGINFRQLGVIARNANVQVLETRGEWCKIGYEDSTGWAYADYVKAGERPASQPREGTANRLEDLLGDGNSDPATSDSTGSNTPVDTTPDSTSDPAPQPSTADRGRVVYNRNRRVSDTATRDALQKLADHLGKTVVVHSGDRGTVVRGSNSGSLHVRHRAADFHVPGMSDSSVFDYMMLNHAAILGGGSYEVIIHRAGTNTGGPHIHLGNYKDGRGTYYKSERGGNYTRIAHKR